MTDQSIGPTLSDDEAALAQHAQVLCAAIESVAGAWVQSSIASRSPQLADSPQARHAAEAASMELGPEVRHLLSQDIGDQTEGPLQVLRRGVRYATSVLIEAEVPPVERDAFAIRSFPDDVYDLSPASFGSVHPSLTEPGLIWGAAKAHVHLRRRREADRVTGDQ